MNKRIIKKSKKGFSLPAAMGITAVLIILSASLIIIASNSISNTSLTVNGRQAYLNVRSALQYAEAYYNNLDNIKALSSSGTAVSQYMVMKDNVGGTVNDGAEVSSNESSTNDKLTYVVATYTPAQGNDTPKLKLTAYANYTDAFGNQGGSSQLSITFDVSNGSGGRRITDPYIPPNTGTSNYDGGITLNVKKRPGQTWGSIAYYIWTYKDEANVYNNKTISGSDGSYGYKPSVEAANKNEQDSNMVRPAGRWVDSGSADKLGPPALVSESGGGMLSSVFRPENKNVNYFNIIFANKGAILKQGDNTQTCEMFHLWYLDPSDKNVYFEFLKDEPWYYKGGGWNGKDNLEDTMLVYVKNTKTTVHFKIKGVDDTALTPTITAPVITSVTVGGNPLTGSSYLEKGTDKKSENITMVYEGCGWWVANIETNDVFKMTISYPGGDSSGMTVTVTPNSNNEAWVYANPNAITEKSTYGTIQSRLSESSANTALGVSSDSYVTIHAKSYDSKNKVTPTLSYKDVQINSSAGRIDLYNKILEAQQYLEDDYTEESYKSMQTTLEEAINMYNDTDFIKKQTGSTTAEKIKNADAEYEKKTKELDDKINALVGKSCDAETMKKLADLVKQGDDIVDAQSKNGKYDSTAYGEFAVEGGAYQEAKKILGDSDLTKGDAEKQITLLQAALDKINKSVLDRTSLKALIEEATTLSTDTKYEQPYRDTLKTKYIPDAQVALDIKETTQVALDTAKTTLQTGIDDVKAHPITPLNISELTKALGTAKTLLETTPRLNCTDETYAALETVYNEAESKGTPKTQSEVDSTVATLKDAISAFVVVKPEAADDVLNHYDKLRVWFDTQSYTLGEVLLINEANAELSHKVTNSELIKDEASGLSYYDIQKSAYSKLSVTVPNGGKKCPSNTLSIDDVINNNMVVKIESSDKSGKNGSSTISLQQLTTLYIEKKTLDNQPLVTVNGKEVKTISDTIGKHYIAKFVYADNQKVVINSKSDGTGTNTKEFDAVAGQFVVRYKTDTDVELINVKNIYPKYEETSASSTGYTISDATIDAENLISPTILANVTDGYSIALTKANTQKIENIDIIVPENKTLVIVNTANIKAFKSGQTPYGHFWKQVGGNKEVLYSSLLLRYDDTTYYYAIVDIDVKGLEIRNGSDKVGGEVIFNNDKYKYVYILVNAQNKNSFTIGDRSNTPLKITRVITPLDADDMTGADLPMAFVGGNKVRATNKSYVETYGSDVKYNQNHSIKINNYNKFGGNGDNQGSMNRVGDSQLNPYYDWYEFKIPVDQLANFTFEIKGLKNASDTTCTEQITSVHGDVWLSLDGTHKNGDGRYDDVSIYTFDPEESQMEYVYDTTNHKTIEKTRIYFNMPEHWSATVTTVGVGSQESLSFTDNCMDSYTGNSAAANYHYVDVDINKPFLTFEVQDASNPSKIKTYLYKTSLQGGDTVLFDPKLNGGNGGWSDYISPQTLLKREVLKAQATYYGSVIVGKYDDNGYVEDNGNKTYNYAGKLYDQYKKFTRYDAAYKADSTISLDKVYGYDNANAYSAYTTLKAWVDAYQNLYSAMSSAKAYIAEPITGGVHPSTSSGLYPEYISRNNSQKYDKASINTLKNKLESAENTYLSSDTDVAAINKSTKTLKTTISNIKVESEGSITVIFYDSQEVMTKNGATVQISYKKSDGTTVIENVTSKNREGYPIIRISDTTLTDVQFIVKGIFLDEDTGKMVPQTIKKDVKDKMLEDSTWVFMDQKGNPKWQENTTCDYVLFTTDNYEQNSSTDKYIVEMKKAKDDAGNELSTYRDIVLYFNYDTTVTRAGGDSFTVKAGAYVFSNKEAGVSSSPFYGATFDLYSDNSKNYFTDPVNYGEINGATDAASLGWVDSSGTLIGAIKSTAKSVNVTAKNTTINTFRKYTSLGSMYFRYEDNDKNFVINNRLTLTAKDFVIASSAAFDGTNAIAPHFYLNGVNYSKDNPLKVTFKSDINVKYRDNTGEDHSFVIREGTYELSKQDESQSFVADFFDESYWKSPFVVCTTVGGAVSNSSTGGSLSNPVYSND